MSFDRFIPCRSTSGQQDYASYQLMQGTKSFGASTNKCACLYPEPSYYQRILGAALLGIDVADRQPILSFRPRKAPIEWTQIHPKKAKPFPYKIEMKRSFQVDYLTNDVYNNLLSASKRFAALPADDALYLYDFHKKSLEFLTYAADQDYIASTAWSSENELAFGTKVSELVLFDVSQKATKSVLDLQTERAFGGIVHKLQHRGLNEILAGCEDGVVRHIDLRSGKFSSIELHASKVCSLALSPSQNLLASGSNQDKAEVCDLRRTNRTLATVKHEAAVMGLDWLDNEHLLSGGGTADKTIRLWCVHKNREVCSVNTGSQVCNLHLGADGIFLTTHGYSDPEINVWQVANFAIRKIKKLDSPHQDRILYSAWNGQDLLTASAPEGTLCHYSFAAPSLQKPKKVEGFSQYSTIR